MEAVKLGAEMYRSGMTEDMFQLGQRRPTTASWPAGRGSLILNAIPRVRAIEAQDPDLAAKIALRPSRRPGGPVDAPYVVSVYVIWRFAQNQEAAKQFLVDLALASHEALVKSDTSTPSFPGAVPDLGHWCRRPGR